MKIDGYTPHDKNSWSAHYTREAATLEAEQSQASAWQAKEVCEFLVEEVDLEVF